MGKQCECTVNCGFLDKLFRKDQVYSAPLANGDIAAVIINWKELNNGPFEFNVADIGITTERYMVKDLWTHETIGPITSTKFGVEQIPGHGNHALRFTPVQVK